MAATEADQESQFEGFGTVRVTLRLPGDIYRAVAREAQEDRRSLNSMLVVLVERGLAQQERDDARP